MLIIRKLVVSAVVYSLVLLPIAAPAFNTKITNPPTRVSNAPTKVSNFTTIAQKEFPITVELTNFTVRTTQQEASRAISSRDALYFDAEVLTFLTVYAAGWSLKEWSCLRYIWRHESNFNSKALNKKSGAYGIPQFLPSTWGNYKVVKTSNAQLQIKYGLRYIKKRYGSACNAAKFWKTNKWY